ncbi:MAG: peptide chain release factor N(5)-glutamine methyltransferase, partial [Mogibacterium sp.]|nr:peptide chain release factor N(5)-glutamine methyltransferase [Mogibacterium sp.]
YNKIFIKDACPTKIGGQAIMEGVMMRGTDRTAVAMRLPSGEFYLKTKMLKPEPKAMKVPLVRGVVAFARSLTDGMGTLMESANILEEYAPEEYEEGKFEAWINKKFGAKAAWNILMGLALVVAVVISIAFFVVLPTWVVNYMGKLTDNALILNLIEGLLRIVLFIAYVLAIRNMEDIRKLFRYHGAEHKTIHCYENKEDLTPENAAKYYTLHPRCGTSFLMFVLIVSILLFSFLGWPNLLWRIVSRLLLIPVIAGISYELLKWAGRSDGTLVKVLSWPGLMLQKLTTAEPTMDQLEVAILALKSVLVDPETIEVEGFVDKDGNIVRSMKEEARAQKEVSEWEEGVKANSEYNSEISSSGQMAPPAGEDEINEAIKFLDNLDADGYTLVATESDDRRTIVEIITDKEAHEAKERTLARRYTADIKTYENALKWGQAALGMIENGHREAQIIMSYATGLTDSEMLTRSKELMREEDFHEYEKRISARVEGMPLQYIVGIQEFMGLPFRVNKTVLIPRFDTEILVEKVLGIIKERGYENPEVLDMCTGSGAIGVSIANKVPGAKVTMADSSDEALHTAMGNAGINKVNKRCIFLVGDMFDTLAETSTYDIIVCNPPYIPTAEIDKLAVEVRKHEPLKALDGGEDGLDYYRVIARDASSHLKSGGILALEIGHDQGKSVTELLAASGMYKDIEVFKDLAGHDRVVTAERI